jgi:diacylglycerol kinase (ATP)
MKTGVIVNPVAGSRRIQTRLAELELTLRAHFSDLTICKTSGPGNAGQLAREMAARNTKLIIAVGGDGTIGETVDGMMRVDAQQRPALGIISRGTGSDFSRTIGQSGSFETQIARVAAGQRQMIDVGRVLYDDGGKISVRYFINVASLGLSGTTAIAVNSARRKSRLPSHLMFYWHTVRELVRYRFQHVSLSLDGGKPVTEKIAVVAAANGRFFGSGMMVAPNAHIDDGLLEFVVVRGASKPTLIRDLKLLYTGSHTNHPAVKMLRGKVLEVVPLEQEDVLIEIDGEAIGRLPAKFEIVPQALALFS